MDKPIYHERQSRQLCLLHSLNNLFQCKAFQKKDFDQICINLSPETWINPHRSLIGFGNYDINVLMAALELKDHEAIWFDKRKKLSSLNLDIILGFILNIPAQKCFISFLNPLNYIGERKHWIAIKKINSIWFNLDSKYVKPKSIGEDKDLLEFMDQKIKDVDCQILIVVNKMLKEEVYSNRN